MTNIEKRNIQVSDTQFSAEDYQELLLQTVAVIESARSAVARHLMATASNTYWEIGKLLHDKKLESKHGSRVVRQLSVDLKERYPKMGMSPRQLWNMKAFYTRYKDSDTKLLQRVALLPWSHNLLMLSKDLDDNATQYYAQECVTKGWNRDLLLNAIKLKMHETHPLVPLDNNFATALPADQAKYANEVFRSTYNLGFLGVTEPILEAELEARLVEKIKMFLLELGNGFTFIGNQHTLVYNGKESRVDLLFFNRRLRCLVAVELKGGKFKPEYAGKLNFYLSALDEYVKLPDENPSIGIILCRGMSEKKVAFTFRDMTKPMGVATYRSSNELPEQYRNILPSAEELQKLL